VLGGSSRLLRQLPRGWRHYPCRREGGQGSVRRLVAAIKGGGIARVIILARSNAHSDTKAVRAVCKRLAVPCEIIDRESIL